MKLTEENIEQIASYMADDLEDHLDNIFWDGITRVLQEYGVEFDDVNDISDEDCEAIVLQTRIMFAPKNN
tara:strand:+ start:265 stop:474 length:210 start_codon:yes stop_codon:yes gene_type:complete